MSSSCRSRPPKRWRAVTTGSAVTVCVAVLAGCGSQTARPTVSGPVHSDERGPITLAAGKDTTGAKQAQIDRWNKLHPDQKVTLVELPESADQQRQQFIQNAQTKSDAYTVLNLDPVWMSEFAAHRWIDQLPEDEFPLDRMIPSVVDTAKYYGRLYGVPYNTNAGLLFYRKDLLDKIGAEPPKTWAEMKQDCAEIRKLPEGKGVSCYAGQFDKYEGLTVSFSEAVASAGGSLTNAKGKPTVNTEAARKGLEFLTRGFADGTFPKASISYQEEQGRRAFQDGKLIFHRQWPYQWALANKTDGSSKVAGKFGVAPLPGLKGPGTSSIGGLNLAISTFGKNKATALDFIKFFASHENARKNLKTESSAPPYADLYSDPELQKKFPYLKTLKKSLDTARPRPKVVNYGDTSAAIQENVYAAMTGQKSVDSALAEMQKVLSETVTKP